MEKRPWQCIASGLENQAPCGFSVVDTVVVGKYYSDWSI
jgi:hypothetical protein